MKLYKSISRFVYRSIVSRKQYRRLKLASLLKPGDLVRGSRGFTIQIKSIKPIQMPACYQSRKHKGWYIDDYAIIDCDGLQHHYEYCISKRLTPSEIEDYYMLPSINELNDLEKLGYCSPEVFSLRNKIKLGIKICDENGINSTI